jgi:hypothetical protein
VYVSARDFPVHPSAADQTSLTGILPVCPLFGSDRNFLQANLPLLARNSKIEIRWGRLAECSSERGDFLVGQLRGVAHAHRLVYVHRFLEQGAPFVRIPSTVAVQQHGCVPLSRNRL